MSSINAAPAGVALLGLVLGMRYATDADHVIAVTAIATREHRLSVTTLVGAVCGAGHTLTILLVGSTGTASSSRTAWTAWGG